MLTRLTRARLSIRASLQHALLQRALSYQPLPLPPSPEIGEGVWTLVGLPLNVVAAARIVTAQLAAAGAPSAIIGAVACYAYGHQRSTSSVDVLINAGRDADVAGLTLVGSGMWARRYPGSRKMLRDTLHGVDVNLVHSGEFPGDSLPNCVTFPKLSPSSGDVLLIHGARIISLPGLLELKLASGTSSSPASQRKDMEDVRALIAANDLPRVYTQELHVSMRRAYCRVWDAWHASKSGQALPTPQQQ